MAQTAIQYAAILILSGSVALATLILSWNRRTSPGGLPLALMMLAMLVWNWTYALHWLFPESPARFYWLDMTYLGVVALPATVIAFSVQISRHSQWLNKKTVPILLIEPLLTLLLLWTDPWHQLFFGGLRSTTASDIFSGGTWFWINVVYSYSLFLFSLILLLVTLLKSRGRVYRSQIGFCMAGLCVLFFVNVMSIMGVHPLPGLDLTPLVFIVTGLFFATSLIAFHMLDVIPIAHDLLIDQMKDGMVVLDARQRVVEVNKVAAQLLGLSRSQCIGKDFRQATQNIPRLSAELDGVINLLAPRETVIQTLVQSGAGANQTPGRLVLDIQTNPLYSNRQKSIGSLIVWRDITRSKNIEDELRRANEILNNQLQQIETLQTSLMEQIIHDPLTGLFNRRFLENTLPKELARAERSGSTISFLMVDIDFFKQINDQHGHDVGDLVLKQLSARLENSAREGDWVIRYGGEEFLMIFADALLEDALARAEYLRCAVSETVFETPGTAISLTVSIGVAIYPQHGKNYQEMFRAADQALYCAKSSGRNCVCSAST